MKFFLLTLCVFFSLNLFAQNSGYIKYSVSIEGKEKVEFNSILYFNTISSLFESDKCYNNYTILCLIDSIEPRNVIKNNYKINTTFKYYTYIDYRKNIIVSGEQVLDSFYVTKQNTCKINWIITKEHKKIGNYDCVKAICEFGGRKYEAWFAKILNFNSGPWKLIGLPGLILEAYDVDRKIEFIFREIKYPLKVDNIKNPYTLEKNITIHEFKILREKYYKLFLQNLNKMLPNYKPFFDYSNNVEKNL